MTIPTRQQAYAQSQGTAPIPSFIFRDRDPTVDDIKYDLYTGWVNTITKAIWYLEAFSPAGGTVTAQWRAVGPIVLSLVDPTASDYLYPIGQTWINTAGSTYWGLVDVVGTTATWVELSSGGTGSGLLTLTGDAGGAVPYDTSRNINLLGASGQVTVTGTPGTNTLTISLAGGSQAIDSVGVDAFTAPGSSPVVPNAFGEIFVTGGQIPAASTANVIQTNSLAANTYTVQVQRSKTEPASNAPSNGVAHFDSADFTVDNTGFVSLVSPGGTAFTGVNMQVFTSSGTYTPTTGMKYCMIEVVGGGGGGGGGATLGTSVKVNVSCGGGGGGGYGRKFFTAATIGASQAVTVGAGGGGGAAGPAGAANTGSSGGATSVGALISVNGGSGGQAASGTPDFPVGGNQWVLGGAGGTATVSGGLGIPGADGSSATLQIDGNYTLPNGGGGGSSYFSGSLQNNAIFTTGGTVAVNGANGLLYGGGGSGGSVFSTASAGALGGNGASGVVVITEYT